MTAVSAGIFVVMMFVCFGKGISNFTNEEKLFTGILTKEDETLFEITETTENNLFDISDELLSDSILSDKKEVNVDINITSIKIQPIVFDASVHNTTNENVDNSSVLIIPSIYKKNSSAVVSTKKNNFNNGTINRNEKKINKITNNTNTTTRLGHISEGIPDNAIVFKETNYTDCSDCAMLDTPVTKRENLHNTTDKNVDNSTALPQLSHVMKIPDKNKKYIAARKTQNYSLTTTSSTTSSYTNINDYLIFETASDEADNEHFLIPTTIHSPEQSHVMKLPTKKKSSKTKVTTATPKENQHAFNNCSSINSTIFGCTANFSIEAVINNSSKCFPPYTYIIEDKNRRLLNFTWGLNVPDKNYSFAFLLPKDDDYCNNIQLNLVEGDQFKILFKNKTKCAAESDANEVTMELDENIYIRFFKLNSFFEPGKKCVKSKILSPQEKQKERMHHIEIGVTIIVILGLAGIIFYLVIKMRHNKQINKGQPDTLDSQL